MKYVGKKQRQWTSPESHHRAASPEHMKPTGTLPEQAHVPHVCLSEHLSVPAHSQAQEACPSAVGSTPHALPVFAVGSSQVKKQAHNCPVT